MGETVYVPMPGGSIPARGRRSGLRRQGRRPAPWLTAAARREPFDDLASFTVRSRLAIEPAPPAARSCCAGRRTRAARSARPSASLCPMTINRAAADETRAAFMLGPDEWLLIGAPEAAT